MKKLKMWWFEYFNVKLKVSVLFFGFTVLHAESASFPPIVESFIQQARALGYSQEEVDSALLVSLEGADTIRKIIYDINRRNKSVKRPSIECKRNAVKGCMFTEKVGDNCGFISSTMQGVYEAVGYRVRTYNTIDGPYDGSLKYRDSHVFNEVYIPVLKSWVIQDATFDISVKDCNSSERLSFEEINTKYFTGDRACFTGRDVSPLVLASIVDDYYTGLPYSIITDDNSTSGRPSSLRALSKVENEKNVQIAFDRCSDLITEDQEILYKKFSTCIKSYVDASVFVSGYFDGPKWVGINYLYSEKNIKTIVPALGLNYGRSYDEWIYVEKQKGDIESKMLPLMFPKYFY